MSNLVKYDQARIALAACRNVDEIKDISDKSEAMRLYAKQANDPELEQWAAEIKLRAQRAIGEISLGMEKYQGSNSKLPTGGQFKTEALADAGISMSSAQRYEQLAKIPEAKVEELIAKSKEAGKPISVKAVLANTATPKPVKEVAPVVDAPIDYEDTGDTPDFVQIADDFQKQRDELKVKLDRYESTDVKKVTDDYDRLHNRLLCETQEKNDWIRKYNFQADLLKKICIAVGVKSSFDILAKLSKS